MASTPTAVSPGAHRLGQSSWRRRPVGWRILTAAAVTITTSDCGILGVGDCTSELRVELRPASAEIAIGQSFTARAALSTCGGRDDVAEMVEWRSSDTTVAVVTAATGRVTARRRGSAEVRAVGGSTGSLGAIPVTVR